MEPRVQMVTLGVHDLARSRAFYRDGLSWEPVLEVGDAPKASPDGSA